MVKSYVGKEIPNSLLTQTKPQLYDADVHPLHLWQDFNMGKYPDKIIQHANGNLLVLIPQQNECFRANNGIKIIVSVKALAGVLKHIL